MQLLDFGVCASQTAPADEKARENGRVFGTPSYVSPEQASGEADVDGRADLFSLGIVMFEALSGHLPFTGASVSKLLLRIIRDPAPRLRDVRSDLDPGLDLIVSRLLARERAERLPSARALSRALAPYLTQRLLVERRLAATLTARSLQSDHAVTVNSAAPAQRVA